MSSLLPSSVPASVVSGTKKRLAASTVGRGWPCAASRGATPLPGTHKVEDRVRACVGLLPGRLPVDEITPVAVPTAAQEAARDLVRAPDRYGPPERWPIKTRCCTTAGPGCGADRRRWPAPREPASSTSPTRSTLIDSARSAVKISEWYTLSPAVCLDRMMISARRTSSRVSAIESAPATIAPTNAGTFRCAFTPALAGSVSCAATSCGSPHCSASATTGPSPAQDTKFVIEHPSLPTCGEAPTPQQSLT